MTSSATIDLHEALRLQRQAAQVIPRPLIAKNEPPEPFPVAALGSVLADAARGIQDKTQAPAGICAQSVLAAATLAVQAHADVVLPTGHARPLSSFFVTVAASGERKSAVDGEALWPVRSQEKNLREDYDAERNVWQNSVDAWDAQRKQILGDKKKHGSPDEKKRALDELGPRPVEPLLPMLTCPEPTVEGLAKLYNIGNPSLGVFSAEGGQFVGGHGMSPDNKLRTATMLSSLWDGDPIKRVRAGDGATSLPGRRLSMHLMVQPDVASQLLTDPQLTDQGLLSRILVTAPESTAGTRLWREPIPESETAIRTFGKRLLSIFDAPLPLADGKPNELIPRRLPMSPEARELWIKFADKIERQIGPDGNLEPIKGLANKLPEHAARISGVLALIADLNASKLSCADLVAGIEIAQHYAGEALRLFRTGQTDPDIRLAQTVLKWLQDTWLEDHISVPDLYQLGPNPVRNKSAARSVVATLEEHSWLIPVQDGAAVKGTARREAWRIVNGPVR